MSYIIDIKSNIEEEYNHGVSFVGDKLIKFDGSLDDKANLLSIARSFSRTLLGYTVPVNYSTLKDESYTDGKSIIISSHIVRDKLDSTIGLVLHESSHIAITDFDTWYSTPDKLKARGISKKYTKVGFNLLNWIEDRRIDNWAYNRASGYMKYYEALYHRYFLPKKVDKLIKKLKAKKKKGKLKPTLNNYMFFIINMMNDNVLMDELPQLEDIKNLIDLHNIDRFNTTEECQEVAFDVLEIILKNIDESDEEDEEDDGEGNTKGESNDSKKDKDGDDSKEDSKSGGDSGESNNEEKEDTDDKDTGEGSNGSGDSEDSEGNDDGGADESDGNEDDSTGESDGDSKEGESGEGGEKGDSGESIGKEESDDTEDENELSDEEIEELINEILSSHENLSEHRPDSDNEIETISSEDLKKIERIIIGVSDEEGLKSPSNPKSNTAIVALNGHGEIDDLNVIIIGGINAKYILGKGSNNLYDSIFVTKPQPLIIESCKKGKILGKKLATKLQLRNEVRNTKIIRQKRGKIHNRTLYTGAFSPNELFYKEHVNKYEKITVHISVDSSFSMIEGVGNTNKWLETMTLLTCLAYAFNSIPSIRLQMSFRSQLMKGNTLYNFFDSDIDKIEKLNLLPHLIPRGGTPEGICFYAMNKKFFLPFMNENTLFINISDGLPSGALAERLTIDSVRDYINSGVQVLSFFIETGRNERNNREVFESFQKMYGVKNSFLIKTNNVMQIAKAINKKLLK